MHLRTAILWNHFQTNSSQYFDGRIEPDKPQQMVAIMCRERRESEIAQTNHRMPEPFRYTVWTGSNCDETPRQRSLSKRHPIETRGILEPPIEERIDEIDVGCSTVSEK